MALERARIILEKDKKNPIEVCFNPTSYTLDAMAAVAQVGIPGLGAPIRQFVHGGERTLSLELLFDTFETGKDVRGIYTDRIYKLLQIERETHAPPTCTFQWNKFSFRCVVERVSGRFTMFLEDGTPVRATLQLTLKEYKEVADMVRENPTQSSDHVKTYTVRRGDTLSSIAAAEYSDPALWRPIARANRIANPLQITPGRVLIIPTIE